MVGEKGITGAIREGGGEEKDTLFLVVKGVDRFVFSFFSIVVKKVCVLCIEFRFVYGML